MEDVQILVKDLTARCSEPRDNVTSVPSVFAIHTSRFMDSLPGLAVAELVSRQAIQTREH